VRYELIVGVANAAGVVPEENMAGDFPKQEPAAPWLSACLILA
jgi:hypothetical protein